MGPHFFKCGKNVDDGFGDENPDMLQWGRTFSSAESLSWGRTLQPLICARFNGAALFQVRKVERHVFVEQIAHCFNGAALFQVRKVVEVDAKSGVYRITLQWGRTFSSAER